MDEQAKPKIYGYCLPWGGDVVGYALTEEGVCLRQHLSSNESFSRYDLGFSEGADELHTKSYVAHYPNGYEPVWLGLNHEGVEGFEKAIDLNHAIAEKEQESNDDGNRTEQVGGPGDDPA